MTKDKGKIGEGRRAAANWFLGLVPAVSTMPEHGAVFDGTSVKTNPTRLKGRFLCGTRLAALVCKRCLKSAETWRKNKPILLALAWVVF